MILPQNHHAQRPQGPIRVQPGHAQTHEHAVAGHGRAEGAAAAWAGERRSAHLLLRAACRPRARRQDPSWHPQRPEAALAALPHPQDDGKMGVLFVCLGARALGRSRWRGRPAQRCSARSTPLSLLCARQRRACSLIAMPLPCAQATSAVVERAAAACSLLTVLPPPTRRQHLPQPHSGSDVPRSRGARGRRRQIRHRFLR